LRLFSFGGYGLALAALALAALALAALALVVFDDSYPTDRQWTFSGKKIPRGTLLWFRTEKHSFRNQTFL